MSKLKEWFFVSESDGHLYDTRGYGQKEWKPLRKEYALVKRECKGNSRAIRAAIRQRYAWPGGYALVAYTSDGAMLCIDCCKAEYRQIACAVRHNANDGWQVVAITANNELENYETCDHCGKAIDGYHETENGQYTYSEEESEK